MAGVPHFVVALFLGMQLIGRGEDPIDGREGAQRLARVAVDGRAGAHHQQPPRQVGARVSRAEDLPEALLRAAERLVAAGCTAIAVVARLPDDEDEQMLEAYRAGVGVVRVPRLAVGR